MPRITSANTKEITNAAAAIRPRRQAPSTPEEIRVRAYEIWVANGRQSGREAQDWAQAEREVRARMSIVTR